MAEECLIEVVDAGVQAADILADLSHLLAESGKVSAHFLAKSGHVLANGGDRTPEAQANPRNRSNATGLKVNRCLAES